MEEDIARGDGPRLREIGVIGVMRGAMKYAIRLERRVFRMEKCGLENMMGNFEGRLTRLLCIPTHKYNVSEAALLNWWPETFLQICKI